MSGQPQAPAAKFLNTVLLTGFQVGCMGTSISIDSMARTKFPAPLGDLLSFVQPQWNDVTARCFGMISGWKKAEAFRGRRNAESSLSLPGKY
jgi:hypothetical protein